MLLLPPSTRPVAGSLGPMLRISNPRTLKSPPIVSSEKIGSPNVSPIDSMYSPRTRNPNDSLCACFRYQIPSATGL